MPVNASNAELQYGQELAILTKQKAESKQHMQNC